MPKLVSGDNPANQPSTDIPRNDARVVYIQDPTHVVINRGAKDGLKLGQRFLIYGLSQEIVHDPETGKELGRVEIVRGTGKVVHIQETMTTLRSDAYSQRGKKKVVVRKNPFFVGSSLDQTEEITEDARDEILPFDDPQKGDYAKPL